ncbi:Alpha-(1,3)-fucosyltransferase 10 [Tupaia chinensis]|uniref:Alpha-(1,3)-fucosyltransferase 10 n=1 Tax=Tupaia chinensis TaxID=246437 RepID=L9L0Z3_TUPCH|nr:Alpha-(1,3)-fucosyltransferase 10 [Tupaia chinensis]
MVRVRRKKLLASCLCITAAIFLLATLQCLVMQTGLPILTMFHNAFPVQDLQLGENSCPRFLLQVAIELGRFHKKMFKVSGLQGGLTETGGGPRHLDAVLRKEVLTWDGLTELGPENVPVMLWWSPLTGDTGRLGQCGADACFFTINRTYLHHPMTKALLFYGLGFSKHSNTVVASPATECDEGEEALLTLHGSVQCLLEGQSTMLFLMCRDLCALTILRHVGIPYLVPPALVGSEEQWLLFPTGQAVIQRSETTVLIRTWLQVLPASLGVSSAATLDS